MAFNFQGNPALTMGMSQTQSGMVGGGPLMGGGMMGPSAVGGGMVAPPGFPHPHAHQMGMIAAAVAASSGVDPPPPPPPPQQPQQLINHPGLNDAPLEFNTNKNKPPMPITGGDIDERSLASNGGNNHFNSKEGEVTRGERGGGSSGGGVGGGGGNGSGGGNSSVGGADRRRGGDAMRRNHKDRTKDHKGQDKGGGIVMDGGTIGNGGMNPVDDGGAMGGDGPLGGPPHVWGGMMPPMHYQMMGMNPMQPMPIMDPNMMMGQFGMMGGVLGGEGMVPENMMVKEVIQLKSVTLIPPAPGMPAPPTRERPPGCKTIFVGGLAENTTEDIIREIFSRCGEMMTVRLSNKKFCHIRFLLEASVDAALYFSGYRMRIDNKTDAANTGRLHVDFAQARDDQYEWECRQRQLQREARHRDRVEKERLRVPSPPPVPHYTEHEASAVAERIKSEDTFGKAVQVVITWLERGDCSKRNASAFYSMIQSTNSHIRRLLSEKALHEEELQKAKDLMKARMQSLLIQYAQIERVFVAASHKKVWDHFTKAQRKNIEMWKKQAAEIKAVELEEHLNTGAEDEMDVSDEDDPMKKKPRFDDKISILKEENDSLKCQLEAYKNEVEVVRAELKGELDSTDAKLRLAQQTLQGMQQQLIEAKNLHSQEELKVVQLKAQLVTAQNPVGGGGPGGLETKEVKEEVPAVTATPLQPATAPEPPPQPVVTRLDENEARLISLISMFLNVHPFGAGVDYVWSYVQKLEPNIRPADIEALLTRFPSLFQQELSGIGANMERRWVIKAFDKINKDRDGM